MPYSSKPDTSVKRFAAASVLTTIVLSAAAVFIVKGAAGRAIQQWKDSSGNVVCTIGSGGALSGACTSGLGGGIGTGGILTITNARFVKKSGDTMTGVLVIQNGNTHTATTSALLKVKGVMSGNTLALQSGATIRGNVSVGKTTQGLAKLDVVGTVSGSLLYTASPTGTNQILGKLAVGNSANQGGLALSVTGSGYIAGNVGIGTTAPNAKLSVAGTISGALLTLLNTSGVNNVLGNTVFGGNLSSASKGRLTIYGSGSFTGSVSGATLYASKNLTVQGTGALAILSTNQNLVTVNGTIEQGLLGWYTMDTLSGSNVNDQSFFATHSNSGALTNGPVQVTGKFGKALQFDGVNDYVRIHTPANMQTLKQITVSVWVRNSFNGTKEIISNHIQANGSPISGIAVNTNTGNTISFQMRANATCCQTVTTVSTVPLNQWFLVTSTWDGASTRIYINGKLNNTLAGVTGTLTMSRDLFLGINADDFFGTGSPTTYQFTGQMDDVRLYNRALSAREITDLYLSGSPSIGGTLSGAVVIQGNLNTLGVMSGSTLTIQSTASILGNVSIGKATAGLAKLEVMGTMSGTALTVSSLSGCASLQTSSAGVVSCAAGLTASALDARYVNVSGDTMTGALTIQNGNTHTPTATPLLNVRGTISGALLTLLNPSGVSNVLGNTVFGGGSLSAASKGRLTVYGSGAFTSTISGAGLNIQGASYVMGNLSVGKTSALAKLDVVGTISGSLLTILNANGVSRDLSNEVLGGGTLSAVSKGRLTVYGSGAFTSTISGAGLNIQGASYVLGNLSVGKSTTGLAKLDVAGTISGSSIVSNGAITLNGSADTAQLTVIGAAGQTTNPLLSLKNAGSATQFVVTGIGNVNSVGNMRIGDLTGAKSKLDVAGTISGSSLVISAIGTTTFATHVYTWPTTQGTNGQLLTNNGSDTLSWTTVTGGGGGGSLSGSGAANRVAYYTGTLALSGATLMKWNAATKQLSVGTLTSRSALHVVGSGSFTGNLSGASLTIQNTGSFMGNVSIGKSSALSKLDVVGTLSGSIVTISNPTGVSYFLGNVSIGKTTSTARLDVAGTMSGSLFTILNQNGVSRDLSNEVLGGGALTAVSKGRLTVYGSGAFTGSLSGASLTVSNLVSCAVVTTSAAGVQSCSGTSYLSTALAEDNTWVGNGTAQAVALPSCSNGTSQALEYNTSTNAYSCATISGSVYTPPSNVLSGSGASSELAFFPGARTLSGARIYYVGTSLGIGASTPKARLTVAGSGAFTGTLSGSALIIQGGASSILGNLSIGKSSAGLSKLEVLGAISGSSLVVNGTTTLNNVAYTWPTTAGSNTNVLTSNGAGTLSWSAPTATTTYKVVYTSGADSTQLTNPTSLTAFNTHVYTIPANDLVSGVFYQADCAYTATHGVAGALSMEPMLGSTAIVAATGPSESASISGNFQVTLWGTAAAGASVAVRGRITYGDDGTNPSSPILAYNTANVATNGNLDFQFGAVFGTSNGSNNVKLRACTIWKGSSTPF